jgi:hypothetical protein
VIERKILIVVSLLALLAGCAGPGFKRADLDPGVQECIRLYAQADRIVWEAGVADRESTSVRGFSYLRTNRYLASVGQQPLTSVQVEAWIDRLQRLDREARKIEFRNLAAEERVRLSADSATFERRLGDCADALRRHDRSDPDARKALSLAAEVPSSYSTAQRVFGLYPITSAFFHAGVRNLHREIREDFQRPLEELPVRGRIIRYGPPGVGKVLSRDAVALVLERAADNPLGIPEPKGLDRKRLFLTFAPVWEVDVASEDDRIGAPAWRGGEPVVEVKQPVVYTRVSHTRFEGQTLLQLNYVIWFPARTRDGIIDPLAGRLDGLIWRVTLAPDGIPLIYDTIHNCGCYHMFFPGERLEPVPGAAKGQEPLLIPQRLTDRSSARRVIRLAAGSHYVQRVYSDKPGGNTTYELAHYRALRSLPTDEGRHRSLFSANGLVPSSVRGERWFLWPSGVKSPGAMRQWGHHAVAFLGTRHFDDPELIARYFRLRERPMMPPPGEIKGNTQEAL